MAGRPSSLRAPWAGANIAAQMTGLEALERRVRRDLDLLHYPRRPWMERRFARGGQPILDVLIIGAGQGGLVCAAALARESVTNVLVVDENPAGRAGPWLNFARMHTLRTPKHLTGPDLGIPNLTIQAWYEAQHGDGAWSTLGLIPKELWAQYLEWYRSVLELPVRADTRIGAIEFVPEHDALVASIDGSDERLFARRIVLATGIDGSGAWHVPSFVADSLPRERYAHTRDAIDFSRLVGKRVGVLGAGASAFDNAAAALEAGAAEVGLFFRRPELVRVNAYRWAEFVGFLRHHADLPDADRWRFIRQIVAMGQLPPADTWARAKKFAGFRLHAATPWESVSMDGDAVRIVTPKGDFCVDFVIAGTGFQTDLSRRPELKAVAPHIALWRDRFTPPAHERNPDLERHPYLGPAFEFTARNPATAAWVSRIHNYTFGCLVSLGFGGASISGMKYSVQRLVAGITRAFFVEDRARHLKSLLGYDTPEF